MPHQQFDYLPYMIQSILRDDFANGLQQYAHSDIVALGTNKDYTGT